MLSFYDPKKHTTISADAINYELGAASFQNVDGVMKPVACAPRTLNTTEIICPDRKRMLSMLHSGRAHAPHVRNEWKKTLVYKNEYHFYYWRTYGHFLIIGERGDGGPWGHCCVSFVVCWWHPQGEGGAATVSCASPLRFLFRLLLDSAAFSTGCCRVSYTYTFYPDFHKLEVKWTLTLSKSDVFCVG